MKNARSLIMLIIALLAGLAAVVLAAKWIQQQSQQGGNKIAVMLLDVQLGSRLTPEMIQLVDWPIGSVPEGAFSDPKALDGRVVRTSLARGEPRWRASWRRSAAAAAYPRWSAKATGRSPCASTT